jgi:hypothetical protein
MAPYDPPGLGAQWPEESVRAARERNQQEVAYADYLRGKRRDQPSEPAGLMGRIRRRLSGLTGSPTDPRRRSSPE